jgi:PAS domain S-box-containing protein
MEKIDYSVFFRKSMEMHCIARNDGYFLELNPRWTEVLGFSIKELKSKPYLEFVHPDDLTPTLNKAQIITQTGAQVISFENRYLTADGTYRWLSWSSVTVGDLVYATARDITDLKDQQRYFNKMQYAANIGYWRIDLETNTPVWSDKTYEIHEIPIGQKVDMSKALDFYPLEARGKISKALSDGLTKGTPWDLELPFITAKGSHRWVRAIGIPVIENNKATEIYGIFQDITERHDIAMRLNYLVQETGDGLWDWRIQEDYEYMSPRFWEILGYSSEEKEHHPAEWQKLIFEEDLKVALKNYELHVATRGEHPFWQEARYKHKDGSTVWVVCQGKVIEWGENGQPIRMIGSHTDVTNLKKAQMRLSESAKLASLGEMAGGIAHEINNPLAIISVSNELIRNIIDNSSSDLRQQLKKPVDTIGATVERISGIISGMRQLLGSESKKSFQRCGVESILNQTLCLCSEKIKSKSIGLKIDNKSKDYIMGNVTQLSQVILNLIQNSIHAVEQQPQNREIQIKVESVESLVKIIISDSGPGVVESNRGRIFEPFFTTKEVGEGTGLGLSISREIVKNHGGTLYLDSSQSITTFVIELPTLTYAKVS